MTPHGWIEINSTLPKGVTIKLQHGELLQDGCFYNANLRSASQEYHYTSDGNPKTIRPHFTFFGYRYAKLTFSYINTDIKKQKNILETLKEFRNPSEFFELLEQYGSQLSLEEAEIEAVKSMISKENFTACVLYSDLSRTGNIVTSDPDINRLFLNSLWSQKSNFIDVPTDCPQRDERLGWGCDAQLYSRTAYFNMDSSAFFEKYLYDIHQEQSGLEGAVPAFTPHHGLKNLIFFIPNLLETRVGAIVSLLYHGISGSIMAMKLFSGRIIKECVIGLDILKEGLQMMVVIY